MGAYFQGVLILYKQRLILADLQGVDFQWRVEIFELDSKQECEKDQ